MTLPRRVLPNRTYLITRRCSERRFFLRPDPQITQIFEYLLAVACERHEILLHGFACMSNHYHLVITDRNGRLPEFQQHLNSLLARAVNCARGRWEAFWSRESYNAVELLEPDVVLDKLAYTLLNPVRAGLVGRTSAWEGATSASLRFGGRRLVTRPTNFFSDDMPDQALLKLVAPDLHDGLGLDEQLANRIEAVELEIRKSGRTPMGMRAVLAQHWNVRCGKRLSVGFFAGSGTRPFGAAKRLSVGFFFNRAASVARNTTVRSGEKTLGWVLRSLAA
jgi:putative transposase